ncbi:MAG TPA: hypothetical protein VEJ44_07460, partial [Acidimicrobiales bacterium]|nr:hypothetical protein [Acidimicrobiales bacterium]
MKNQTGRGLFRFVDPSGAPAWRRRLCRSLAVALPALGIAALLQIPGMIGSVGASPSPTFTFGTPTILNQGTLFGGSQSIGGQPSVSSAGPAVVGTATTYVSSRTTTAQTAIPTGTGSGDVLVSLITTATTTNVTCPA